MFKTKLVVKEILSITIKTGIDDKELVCTLFFKLSALCLSYFFDITSYDKLKMQTSFNIYIVYWIISILPNVKIEELLSQIVACKSV